MNDLLASVANEKIIAIIRGIPENKGEETARALAGRRHFSS